MLESDIANYSAKYINLPINAEERAKLDKELSSLPGGIHWPGLRDKTRATENPEESDQKFKIRQVWSLISESSTQMLELNSILQAIENDSYYQNGFRIAGKSLLNNAGKSLTTTGTTALGGALGSFITPGLGTIIGSILGGLVGGIIDKKFTSKNSVDVLTKISPELKIKNLYPSRKRMDRAISKAYLGYNYGADGTTAGSNAANFVIKEFISLGKTMLRFVPVTDLGTLVYDRCKVNSGLAIGKIIRLREFTNELEDVLKNERIVAENCFTELRTNTITPNIRTQLEDLLRLTKIQENPDITVEKMDTEFATAISLIDANQLILDNILNLLVFLIDQQEIMEIIPEEENIHPPDPHDQAQPLPGQVNGGAGARQAPIVQLQDLEDWGDAE